MIYDSASFLNDTKELGIELTKNQVNQFVSYYELLTEWNSFMNLTAITEFDDVMKKHFTDSLSLVKVLPDIKEKSYRLIDIGTGAGFPGIPLKIAFPHLQVILLDSLNKRISFLNEVIAQLGLNKQAAVIDAFHGRAEDFAGKKEYREGFDLCVSRAVANLSTLSEYCLPFVKKEGYFISYKSEKIAEELADAGKAIDILGGSFTKQEMFSLPSSDISRCLLLIKKIKHTPSRYPRKSGLPSKEPIK